MTYRFGPFVADRAAYRVSRGVTPLDLTPKLLDLLFYLLDRPSALVTKEELLDGVWPGANVTDNALAQAMSELRDALGDSPAQPTYIRTVARRGYRFVAPIETTNAEGAPARSVDTGAAAKRISVAVLDFTDVTEDPSVAWLRAGFAETVASDLSRLNHFRVIDRGRVVRAARLTDGSLPAIAEALNVPAVVTGSFQRLGTQLRLTARLVDVGTGETLADAKLDGSMDDVFALQDAVVGTFARTLGLPAPQSGPRLGVRETASLEAYRAYIEGWLKIESLDTDSVGAAVADFQRAIALDPRYAVAYAGLASAECVAFEMTRLLPEANTEALESGIEHARYAVELDPQLAEAHATLSFLLVSVGQFDGARTAAQTAVALEPDSWRHQYRLGHALWGEPRLRAFDRARALYPQFAFTTFESAMVQVARGHLSQAEDLARQGVIEQDRQVRSNDRFPSIGFHSLLGALESARGRHAHAITEFNQEFEQADRRRLYGPEYAAFALVARGHAELASGRGQDALASFRAARLSIPDYPQAFVGEALALAELGKASEAEGARRQAHRGAERYHRTGRNQMGAYALASAVAAEGNYAGALSRLDQLLQPQPPNHVGWMIPLEPTFRSLHGLPGFAAVLERLASRAR